VQTSFFILIGGFLTGVLWRSCMSVGVYGVVAVLAVCLCAALVLWRRVPTYVLGLGVLGVCTCMLGVVRTEWAYRSYEHGRVRTDGTLLTGTGVVVREPDTRERGVLLTLALDPSEGGPVTVVRATVPPHPVFHYGDRVRIVGTVREPTAFDTGTGRTFDYPGYLMKEGVHYEVSHAKLTSESGHGGSRVVSRLLEMKQAWLASLSRLMPEPEASLAGGLVVGAKRSLGERWLDAFRTSGLIHLVVLSGYNLTLVANGIVRGTRRLPRGVGFALAVCGVVGFVCMVGASATVVRASVMALVGMLAAYTSRPAHLVRALAFAGGVMVLWNPFVLVFDPGFQLSFAATVGLIFAAPLMERFLTFVPAWGGVRGVVGATLATQCAVLPLLLYQVGTVSLVAPFVNLLVLPVVPFIMALVFVAGLCGMVSVTLTLPIAWGAHLLLAYVFTVVERAAALPFAAVALPPAPWWVIVLLYLGLSVLVWYAERGAVRAREACAEGTTPS